MSPTIIRANLAQSIQKTGTHDAATLARFVTGACIREAHAFRLMAATFRRNNWPDKARRAEFRALAYEAAANA